MSHRFVSMSWNPEVENLMIIDYPIRTGGVGGPHTWAVSKNPRRSFCKEVYCNYRRFSWTFSSETWRNSISWNNTTLFFGHCSRVANGRESPKVGEIHQRLRELLVGRMRPDQPRNQCLTSRIGDGMAQKVELRSLGIFMGGHRSFCRICFNIAGGRNGCAWFGRIIYIA